MSISDINVLGTKSIFATVYLIRLNSFATKYIVDVTQLKVRVKVMLRPTVSSPVYLGIKHPSGA
jgi:hypothetical protein